jgi:thymidylate kinase
VTFSRVLCVEGVWCSKVFVYFLGPNGVGKSTQIKLLIDWLKGRKVKTKIAYVQCNHLPVLILEGFIIRLGRSSSYVYPDGTRLTNPSAEIMQKIKYFWFCLQFLSIVFLSFVRVYLPLLLGYTVVAERYVLDSVSDLYWFSRHLKVNQRFFSSLVKVLLYLVPENTVIVHLDAPYDVLRVRYGERGSVVQPREYVDVHHEFSWRLPEAVRKGNVRTVHFDSSVDGISEISDTIKEMLMTVQTC